jgi:hypothetical protein
MSAGLTEQMMARSGAVRDLLMGMSAQLNALRGMEMCEEAAEGCTALRVDAAVAVGHLNALDACLAAVAAVGDDVRQQRAVQLMLRSLHRVGDHSMDRVTEEVLG